MHVADTLSRATVSDGMKEQTGFETELEFVCIMDKRDLPGNDLQETQQQQLQKEHKKTQL